MDIDNIDRIIDSIIDNYHEKILRHLKNLISSEKLKLDNLIKIINGKNNYLAGGEGIKTAQDYVKWCLDGWFISSKETKFGSLVMEELARDIATKYNKDTKKSTLQGIDFEIPTDTTIDLVQNKSGSKWSNSDSLKKMIQNLQAAKIKYLSDNPNEKRIIRLINGCCYGKGNKIKTTEYGSYHRICGQEYWEYLTGDDQFYIKLIYPIIKNNKSEKLNEEYAKVVNSFTQLFLDKFCKNDMSIDWDALLKLSSGKKDPKPIKKNKKSSE